MTSGSPATTAGVPANVLIVSVGGHPTPTGSDLIAVLANLAPGQDVPMVIERPDGSKRTLQVLLGELSADAGPGWAVADALNIRRTAALAKRSRIADPNALRHLAQRAGFRSRMVEAWRMRPSVATTRRLLQRHASALVLDPALLDATSRLAVAMAARSAVPNERAGLPVLRGRGSRSRRPTHPRRSR